MSFAEHHVRCGHGLARTGCFPLLFALLTACTCGATPRPLPPLGVSLARCDRGALLGRLRVGNTTYALYEGGYVTADRLHDPPDSIHTHTAICADESAVLGRLRDLASIADAVASAEGARGEIDLGTPRYFACDPACDELSAFAREMDSLGLGIHPDRLVWHLPCGSAVELCAVEYRREVIVGLGPRDSREVNLIVGAVIAGSGEGWCFDDRGITRMRGDAATTAAWLSEVVRRTPEVRRQSGSGKPDRELAAVQIRSPSATSLDVRIISTELSTAIEQSLRAGGCGVEER